MQFIDRSGFADLLAKLCSRGYELIGPIVRDGAILLGRIEGVDDLPLGVHEQQEAGTYRLSNEPGDDRMFVFSHGPDSAKRYLFPARELLETVHRDGGSIDVVPADPPEQAVAFVGLRSCDLHAIAVQDRVFLGGAARDERYAARRERAFFVAVDCAEPGGTCFCASSGTGPTCSEGFDLALTELEDGFLVRTGSDAGEEVLAAVTSRTATEEEEAEGARQAARAVEATGRSLDRSDLPDLLYRNRAHPRWGDVASRCLACSNCTAVCPTCFCHDVVDAVDLLGTTATRTREWAFCFERDFSHIAGGDVRASRESRYRQWLTHKFASWIDQFGTSGCIGCGRCITWCPVGIDVTEEIDAIRATDGLVEVEA